MIKHTKQAVSLEEFPLPRTTWFPLKHMHPMMTYNQKIKCQKDQKSDGFTAFMLTDVKKRVQWTSMTCFISRIYY